MTARREEHGDLAISYYILYADLMITTTTSATATATAAAPTIRTEKAASSSSDCLDEPSSSSPSSSATAVWMEDEWTEEDERRAARLLCPDNVDDDVVCRAQRDDGDNDNDERQKHSHDIGQPHTNAVRIVDDTVAWNRFYRQHQTRFFKDRHYLLDTFPDEFRRTTTTAFSTTTSTLVEFGCGVGNAVWPVLELGWAVIGVDFSATAIALFQADERFLRAGKERARAYVMDITCSSTGAMTSPSRPTGGPDHVQRRILHETADVATLLFCLSAIPPDRQIHAVRNVVAALRPGGVIIVRDYGRYDQAQFQLHQRRRRQPPQQHDNNNNNNQRLVDHFYQKQDGTKVYYFTTDDLLRLFGVVNVDNNDDGHSMTTTLMEVLECRYLRRVYRNRATGTARRRVWVQARFRKKLPP
jgi:SAM-dependent methyltransferase